jgi:ATP-dependent protease ClpP protease subunit
MLKLDLESGSTPQLYLYGLIAAPSWWSGDDAISAAAVLELLSRIDPASELIVRLNSEGGDVFQGVAIYNALARWKARVEVHIDALAASIASVIACAGDHVVIAGNAMIMIHRAWTIADGDSPEFAKVSQTLAQVDETILNTYEARAGKKTPREQLAAMVDAETWMGPDEAVERGFADAIGDLKAGVEASVRAGQFRNTPKQLLKTSNPKPSPQPPALSTIPAIAARIAETKLRLRRQV